ncbi:MAG: hypothetical protein QG657_612 [Acidobacteriota bacterium]|nr:hypothetical protein [Acidobacteriota bacterium]
MNKTKLAMIFILLVSLTTSYMYGFFAANESCTAFVPAQCTPGVNKSLASGANLGQLIIDGGGYFLQSNGDFQVFLAKVELSAAYGANFEELRACLDKAIENMKIANSLYYEIWQLSLALDYDPVVLGKLKGFDYIGYQIKNGLNPATFGAVSSLLKKGDVRGAYRAYYLGTEKLLAGLKEIKAVVDANQVPVIARCWRLNQSYLELELFGQYIAEVFMNLN